MNFNPIKIVLVFLCGFCVADETLYNKTSIDIEKYNLQENTIQNLKQRPFFSGSTATLPPRVNPGKPWPSRPQDYADFSVTTPRIPQIDDRFKETTTEKRQPSSNVISNVPKPNRPSFAGSATTPPPKVKPGKPWPSRPQDYADFSVTTPRIPQIDDRFKETTTEKRQPSSNVISNVPKPNRPSFAGSATTPPPKVKPGKPWPSRPQDYADFSDTTPRIPQIDDRFKETTTEKRQPSSNVISNVPKPNRPSFAGSATTPPPKVKPGKPWPSRPQDYADFSDTTPRIPQIDDRFKETTTEKRQPSSNVISNVSKPNRPSFAGSATTPPPIVPPGKPWPSRPQDYTDFSVTTPRIPQIDDRFKETTTEKKQPSSNVISNISKPNRPSFAGSATTPPPIVPPGKPWPSRPQDYTDFSVTTPRIPQIDDRFKETTTEKKQPSSNVISNISKPNRPSFAGSATTPPPIVPPGKPWPSRPQDYTDFSVTTPRIPQIDDRFKETTTEKKQPSSNVISNISKPNRPSFAGSVSTLPPIVKPQKPQIEDRFKETTTEKNNVNFISNLPIPSRPSFCWNCYS